MLNFIHLTDCHLLKNKTDSLNGCNRYESLSKTILLIKQEHKQLDFILVTGDISQNGSIEGYALFQECIKTLNKPVYCLPGNHDNPNDLKHICKSSPNQAISVNFIKQHLLILLNSQKEGCEYGEISISQLQQLENILTKNSNHPVIIALHHPPIKINSEWLDNICLSNRKILLTLLGQFQQVKMILFGHVHQEIETTYQHIQIFGSPSSCYQFKPKSETRLPDKLNAGYRFVKFNNNIISTQIRRINS